MFHTRQVILGGHIGYIENEEILLRVTVRKSRHWISRIYFCGFVVSVLVPHRNPMRFLCYFRNDSVTFGKANSILWEQKAVLIVLLHALTDW